MDLPISFEQYIAYLTTLGNVSKEEAEKIARKAYVEQWGKTPEEHRAELNSYDWSNYFNNSTVFDAHNKVDKQSLLAHTLLMSCVTPNICDSQDLFKKCGDCQLLIGEAAIKSALNMGTPDRFGCGHCGNWYLTKDYFEHPCISDQDIDELLTPQEEEMADEFLKDNEDLMNDLVESGD